MSHPPRHLALLSLTALVALAACRDTGPPPDVAAELYLKAGANEDPEAAKAFVVPRCHDKPEGRVEAIRMLGAPMTIKQLSVTVDSQTKTDATVSFTARGSVDGAGGKTTLFGAEVETGKVSIKDATKKGTLKLKKVEGKWMVTCE